MGRPGQNLAFKTEEDLFYLYCIAASTAIDNIGHDGDLLLWAS
jgi:hypothetical protein